MISSMDDIIKFVNDEFKWITDNDLVLLHPYESDMSYDFILDRKEIRSDDYDFIGNGMTKMVFAPKKFKDIVIKIPIVGFLDEDHDISYYDSGSYFCESISNTYRKDGSFIYDYDYCNSECFLYEKAVKRGVSDFFASTRYLCEVNNTSFYISDRCYKTPRFNKTKKYYKNVIPKEMYSTYEFDMSNKTMSSLIVDYGLEAFNNLIDFLDRYEISDIHSANVMFLKDKIKIVDYSSFND